MNQSVYSLWIGRESCYNLLKKRPVWMIQMDLKELRKELEDAKKKLESNLEYYGYHRHAPAHLYEEYCENVCNKRNYIEAYEDFLEEKGVPARDHERLKVLTKGMRIMLHTEKIEFDREAEVGKRVRTVICFSGEKTDIEVESVTEEYKKRPGPIWWMKYGTKDKFGKALLKLFLEEWEEYYEGEQQEDCPSWELKLWLEDEKEPLKWKGCGAYPWNFCLLAELMGENVGLDSWRPAK